MRVTTCGFMEKHEKLCLNYPLFPLLIWSTSGTLIALLFLQAAELRKFIKTLLLKSRHANLQLAILDVKIYFYQHLPSYLRQ